MATNKFLIPLLIALVIGVSSCNDVNDETFETAIALHQGESGELLIERQVVEGDDYVNSCYFEIKQFDSVNLDAEILTFGVKDSHTVIAKVKITAKEHAIPGKYYIMSEFHFTYYDSYGELMRDEDLDVEIAVFIATRPTPAVSGHSN